MNSRLSGTAGAPIGLATAILVLLSATTQAAGDTLTLRGGTVLEGELFGFDPKSKEVKFRLKEGGVFVVKQSEVEQITFGDTPFHRPQVRPEDLAQGWVPIPGGFAYRNVELIQQVNGVAFSGELLNRSGVSYRSATFNLLLYDASRKLARAEPFTVEVLPPNTVRRFEGSFGGGLIGVEGYRIRFESGR